MTVVRARIEDTGPEPGSFERRQTIDGYVTEVLTTVPPASTTRPSRTRLASY